MIKIACVGDNVVDINYVDRMINPGGNCVNVAAYAAQLGHDVSYVGILADDKYADILTESFRKLNIKYDHCPVLHGETGRCFCDLIDGDRQLGDENDGGLVKSDPLQITEELAAYLQGFDIIHTSCYSYIDDQLHVFREHDIPVVYDFSTKWDEDMIQQVCPEVDYVLFSEKEDVAMDEAAEEQMLSRIVSETRCKIAILTKGTKGAVVCDGDRIYRKEPYNVAGGAIDTTGCGDSWIAGFITTYIEGCKRLEILKNTSCGNFIVTENEQDYLQNLIHMSMCMANLKARHTSQIKGGYGYGKSIEDFEAGK